MRERPDSEGGASRNCHQSPFGFAAAPRSTVWQRLDGQEDKPSPKGGPDDDSSRIDETGGVARDRRRDELLYDGAGTRPGDRLQLRYSSAGSGGRPARLRPGDQSRSEEHTSELQSLMRISYAVFGLKKKNT